MKRYLSILLALAMVFSFTMPIASAADTQEGITKDGDFYADVTRTTLNSENAGTTVTGDNELHGIILDNITVGLFTFNGTDRYIEIELFDHIAVDITWNCSKYYATGTLTGKGIYQIPQLLQDDGKTQSFDAIWIGDARWIENAEVINEKPIPAGVTGLEEDDHSDCDHFNEGGYIGIQPLASGQNASGRKIDWTDGAGTYLPATTWHICASFHSTTYNSGKFYKSGYTQIGWTNNVGTTYYFSNSGNVDYTAGPATVSGTYGRWYAVWQPTTATLSYNANGATSGSPPSNVTYAYNSSVTVGTQNTLDRAGYTFLYWNTSSSGTGTTYLPGSRITLNGNYTLYAIWQANATITLAPKPLSLFVGESKTMTATLTRAGDSISTITAEPNGIVSWSGSGNQRTITGITAGKTTLTVRTAAGAVDTCVITVNPATISLSKDTAQLDVGAMDKISYTLSYAGDSLSTITAVPEGIISFGGTDGSIWIEGLSKGTTTLTAKTTGGAVATCTITVIGGGSTTPATYRTEFPDENFRNFILEEIIGDGRTADDEISTEDAAVMAGETVLDVSSLGIASLAGLKSYFITLQFLDASDNLLSGALDVSDLQLVTLDVSDNNALTELYCNNNRLVNLVLFNNPALEILDCSFNQLDVLDLSGLASGDEEEDGGIETGEDEPNGDALTHLYCNNNLIEDLDVSNSVNLVYLDCSYNLLEDLDVSSSIILEELYCNDNMLEGLDLSDATELRELYCFNNYMGDDPDESVSDREGTKLPSTPGDSSGGSRFKYFPQYEDDEFGDELPPATPPAPGSLGSAENPIPIETEADLQAMVNGNYYHHYELLGDIELTGSVTGGEVHGVLNGNGHSIIIRGDSSVMAMSLGVTPVALYGSTNEASAFPVFSNAGMLTTENLTLEWIGSAPTKRLNNVGALIGTINKKRTVTLNNITSNIPVVGGHTVGGLIGRVYGKSNVTIENCTINQSVNGDNHTVGGLIGRISTMSNITIVNCTINESVIGVKQNVGGLIGRVYGISTADIQFCDINSPVNSQRHNVGGIVGSTSPMSVINVEYCDIYGDISGNNYVGGIAGSTWKSRIYRCTVTGNVIAADAVNPERRLRRAGGIVGRISGTSKFQSMIRECEMLGSVSGSSAVGGIAGKSYRTTIVDCRQGGGKITSATNTVGGIVGHAYYTTILRCYSNGTIEATGSMVTKRNGTLKQKDGQNVGGIVGFGFNKVEIRACVALNPQIIGHHKSVDRISGKAASSSKKLSANNFALATMSVTRVGSSKLTIAGEDVSAGEVTFATAKFANLSLGSSHTATVDDKILQRLPAPLAQKLRAPVGFNSGDAWHIAFDCDADESSTWIAFCNGSVCGDASCNDYHYPILRMAGNPKFTVTPNSLDVSWHRTFNSFDIQGLVQGERIISFDIGEGAPVGFISTGIEPLSVTGDALTNTPITLVARTSAGRTAYVVVSVVKERTATPEAPMFTDDRAYREEGTRGGFAQIVNPNASSYYRLTLYWDGDPNFREFADVMGVDGYDFGDIMQQNGPGVYYVTLKEMASGCDWSLESNPSEEYIVLATPTALRWVSNHSIAWDSVPNAVSYEVELYEYGDHTMPYIITVDAPNTSFNIGEYLFENLELSFSVTAFAGVSPKSFVSDPSEESATVLVGLQLVDSLDIGAEPVRLSAGGSITTQSILLEADTLYIIEFRLTGSGAISVLGENFTVEARNPVRNVILFSSVASNDSFVFTHVSGNPSISIATISKYVLNLIP